MIIILIVFYTGNALLYFTEYLFDFNNDNYNWDEAKQFCEDIGAHLAIPATAEEWEDIQEYV